MKDEINLLPGDFYMPRDIYLRNLLRVFMVVSVIIIFFFSFFYLEYKREALKEEVDSLLRESHHLKARLVSLEERQNEAYLERLTEDSRAELIKRIIPWNSYIEKINSNSGDSIAISLIRGSKDGDLIIEGAALSLEDTVSLSRQLSSLSFIDSSVVERIELRKVKEDTFANNSDKNPDNYYFFSLACCFLNDFETNNN